ncbi:MAG TPA: hypothetical protein VGH89_32190 [Pseudonocardia sp.]|jgi:hypothetical protein
MKQRETLEVAEILARLAVAEDQARTVENLSTADGLALAQRIIRELSGWPVEADSPRS